LTNHADPQPQSVEMSSIESTAQVGSPRVIIISDPGRAERGLAEEIQRVAASENEDEALRALDSALDRAHSLEDWHRRRLGEKRYFAERGKTTAGRILAGLMYVRGLTHHQLAITGDLTDTFSNTFTHMFGTLTWRPFNQLPAPDKPERRARDERYKAHVQGQPVLDTLKAAQRFLTKEITAI
jgi:hypothetical protein